MGVTKGVNEMATKATAKTNGKAATVATMTRTTGGLRSALFDEIDALRSGDSNPARARALSSLANTALKSVEVEIEFQKYVMAAAKNVTGRNSSSIGVLELS